MITEEQLAPLCARPQLWVGPLNAAMDRFTIDTLDRMSMFLAQCAHESARFVRLQENLNYSVGGLLQTWPSRFTAQDAAEYAMRPSAIANRAYANRGGNGDEASGDGWRYRGRGPLQITLRNNYAECGEAIDVPLLDDPDLLLEPEAGALAAGWYWHRAGCNNVADEGDFEGVSGLVNRGDRHKAALHLDERYQWLRKAVNALA